MCGMLIFCYRLALYLSIFSVFIKYHGFGLSIAKFSKLLMINSRDFSQYLVSKRNSLNCILGFKKTLDS